MSRFIYRPNWTVNALALVAVLSAVLALSLDASSPAEDPNNTNADAERTHLNPDSHAAEMVENPDFEADKLAGWSLVSESGKAGEMVLDTESPFDANNPHSLRITVENDGDRCSVKNSGTSKMKFDTGTWYDLTFCARTENNKHFGLVVSLEGADGQRVCGRATIPEVGGGWSKYTLAIHARQSAAKGQLVITVFEPGTIWLDSVSLCPRESSQ